MTSSGLCRTLIVDDERLIRQGIRHFIDWEKEGFEIIGEASNGQEALEIIELTKPHIILVDIVMPIMDGEELTKIVKKRFPEIEIIILSSFGEFEYVRSTFQSGVVDYILKPQLDAQSLLKALKTAASRIPSLKNRNKNSRVQPSMNQIVDRLIAGYEVQVDPILISNIFPYNDYWLLGLNQLNTGSGPQSMVKEKLVETIDTGIQQSVILPIRTNGNTQVILINGLKSEAQVIEHLLTQFLQSHPAIRCVLTEPFDDFFLIGSNYKQSLTELINYQFYFPDQRLLTKQNLPVPPPSWEHFNLDWFTEQLKRKQFDTAFHYLKEHVKKLSTCYTTEVYEYKSFFGNILFNITILLRNMNVHVNELEQAKYAYFKAVDEADSAQETVSILHRFLEEAACAIQPSDRQQEDVNMNRILQYIKDHFAEPLTLTGLANHFHFNPSYLSNYFSTHNKEGFIEYLNKIRIEEAAKLLRQGKTPISLISSMVGYSDHSYFCKVFKKLTGLSPSQYRRKLNS